MEVARCKCPPVWVDAALREAMATTGTVLERHRGYVVIDAAPAQ